MEVALPNKIYNLELLDAELRAELGTKCSGVVGRKSLYAAVLIDSADNVDVLQALSIAGAHDATQPSQQQRLLTSIRAQAQGAVGVALTDLTAGQVRSLMALLLWKAGGVDQDAAVRPLAEWLT